MNRAALYLLYTGKNTRDMMSVHALHPLQDYAANCPPEERRNGETQRSSCSSWPLVRAKSSAAVEDERKVLCESLNSSASNSQYSLTSLPLPAPPPQAYFMVPVQPNTRVRATSHVHPCFPACLFPSQLLAPCLFLLSKAMLSLTAVNILLFHFPHFAPYMT